MGHIRYTVKIMGHEAPFQWEIFRYGPSASAVIPTTDGECRGEASTYDEAVGEAYAAARDAEWKRKHRATVIEVDLFDFEDEPKPSPALVVADVVPEKLTDPWPYMD